MVNREPPEAPGQPNEASQAGRGGVLDALTVVIGPSGVSCPHCHATAPMSRCAQFLLGHVACCLRVPAALGPLDRQGSVC